MVGMFKILLIFFSFLSASFSFGQLHVRLVLNKFPQLHTTDTIYAAGHFNTWDPHDNNSRFKSVNVEEQQLDLNLSKGSYEFKLTRGSWNKVECASDGKDIANRSFTLTKDTTINIFINGWRDDFKNETILQKHTASSHVSILDSAFNIPQLNRTRRIWVYLPKDYFTNKKKRFAVLYMHDGQNLFDEATSGFGEWGVDECLDSLFNQSKKECIVIGIDNGPKRMNEYNPYDFNQFGKGEGNEYVDFIVKTLKPYVDKHLRTLGDKKNTFIAGSSMGGLISLYAVRKYPQVFGGAGIFSPAFWTATGINEDVKRSANKIKAKLFFYAGGKESETMIPDMKKIEMEIRSLSSAKIFEEVDPEAKHNEAAWRKYFPDFYKLVVASPN